MDPMWIGIIVGASCVALGVLLGLALDHWIRRP